MLTFYEESKKIATLFSDTVKLDIGIRQENILYSLDIDLIDVIDNIKYLKPIPGRLNVFKTYRNARI